MARSEKNTVSYFPHDVSHDEDLCFIEDKYGNEGYAIWFRLNEKLGNSEFHYIDISNPVLLTLMAGKFKVNEIVMRAIIEDMVNVVAFFDPEFYEMGFLFSQKFVDNIFDAYDKRKNDVITRNSLLSLLMAKSPRKLAKSPRKPIKSSLQGDGNTQIKEDKSKVEKIKEEEIRENKTKENIGDFEILIFPTFEDFWNLYDKKTGYKKSVMLWEKISQSDREKIMQHIPKYKLAQPDKQFRKNPETYLRNEAWNDETIISNGTTHQQSASKNGQGRLANSLTELQRYHANLEQNSRNSD